MKNKKSLSAVIATVLLILLVTVATALVWTFVNNMIKDRMSQVETCFDVESSDKVALNGYYTCFNPTSGEVQFSLSIGDVEIDSLVVSILAGGNSKSFTLNNSDTGFSNLRPYKGTYGELLKLPGKNEGLTYAGRNFTGTEKIDWIKISPVIGEEQCEVTSTINDVENCNLLVNQ